LRNKYKVSSDYENFFVFQLYPDVFFIILTFNQIRTYLEGKS